MPMLYGRVNGSKSDLVFYAIGKRDVYIYNMFY